MAFGNFLIIACLVAMAFFFAVLLFQYLWAITIPSVTQGHVRDITFWEAFRIILMVSIAAGGGFVHYNFH